MTKSKTALETGSDSHLWVKDIQEDHQVRGLYLAKTKRMGVTKKGDPYLSITLSDRTGDVEARVWEKAEKISTLFREGDILRIEGLASSYRNQVQLTLTNLTVQKEGADPSLFLEETKKDSKWMLTALRDLIKGIGNPDLKALINGFFSDHRFVAQFKRAPAAKNFHHNYLGGLLEHTLSVCQMIDSVAAHYHELDKDLLMAGAVLHDIGKVKEFDFDTRFEYSDEGRLLGHLILGVNMVDEKLARLKGFPQDLAIRLKHLILSHHGQYEFGSPKRPKFLEAFALNIVDDLDAKMNGLGRFMERDLQEGSWTEFNRLFDRYFLKGKIAEAEENDDSIPPGEDRQKDLFSSHS